MNVIKHSFVVPFFRQDFSFSDFHCLHSNPSKTKSGNSFQPTVLYWAKNLPTWALATAAFPHKGNRSQAPPVPLTRWCTWNVDTKILSIVVLGDGRKLERLALWSVASGEGERVRDQGVLGSGGPGSWSGVQDLGQGIPPVSWWEWRRDDNTHKLKKVSDKLWVTQNKEIHTLTSFSTTNTFFFFWFFQTNFQFR